MMLVLNSCIGKSRGESCIKVYATETETRQFLNPGGSVKDRVALRSRSRCLNAADSLVIEDAESQGLLHPNTDSVLFEGTVGSTGISLATVGRAKYVQL